MFVCVLGCHLSRMFWYWIWDWFVDEICLPRGCSERLVLKCGVGSAASLFLYLHFFRMKSPQMARRYMEDCDLWVSYSCSCVTSVCTIFFCYLGSMCFWEFGLGLWFVVQIWLSRALYLKHGKCKCDLSSTKWHYCGILFNIGCKRAKLCKAWVRLV